MPNDLNFLQEQEILLLRLGLFVDPLRSTETDLTAPIRPPQAVAKGFRYGGRWHLFSADMDQCSHRRRNMHTAEN